MTKRKKHDDKALTAKVKELRAKDAKWSDIGKKLGITPGKAQFLLMCATVKPADRIKASTDAQLAKLIRRARDKDLLSWGQIAARASTPEGKVKRLYVEAGGSLGSNVASERAPKTKPKSKAKAKTKAKVKTKTKTKTRKRKVSDPSKS